MTNKEKETLKNKYEYVLKKNNEKSNLTDINNYINQEKKKFNFSDEIRNKYKKIISERNSKIKFRKRSNNYGEHWVTINGNHVLIN